MTLFDAPAPSQDTDADEMCAAPDHPVADRVCILCQAPHLPSLLAMQFCGCEHPDLEIRVGVPILGQYLKGWRCQTCQLPNRDALRSLP